MNLVVDAPLGAAEAYVYSGGRALDARLPAVVFVHGAMGDHSEWTLLARWFAHHGHAVLAVDLPGHGRSAGPPLADVEAMGGWLLALLDAAGVERAALVGHSMGSLAAMEAAAQAPARATALAMIGAAFPLAVGPALLETACADPQRAIAHVNIYSRSTLAGKPSFPGPGAWLHGGSLRLMQRMQAGWGGGNLFFNDFQACDVYRRGLEAARAVTCPATLVLGARDQMAPPTRTSELAAALRAEVVLLPAGHALMSETPDALLAALRTALAVTPVAT